MTEVSIQGLDAAVKRMRELPAKVQKSALRKALRKGANVIRKQARENAKAVDDKSTKSSIPKNIVSQTMSRKKLRRYPGADAGMSVGVRGGARFNRESEYPTHWRFKEFGTEKMAAQPFLRPAMNQADAATAAVAAALDKELDKLTK